MPGLGAAAESTSTPAAERVSHDREFAPPSEGAPEEWRVGALGPRGSSGFRRPSGRRQRRRSGGRATRDMNGATDPHPGAARWAWVPP